MMTERKKGKMTRSTAEIVMDIVRKPGREKWRAAAPHDIWKHILLRAEITDALNLGVGLAEVARVLLDDSFWKAKWAYDFPDLLEFVGNELPNWVKPGDPKARTMFRDLPWRRYYYVCRLHMRRIAKMVLWHVDYAQQIGSRIYPTPHYRFGSRSRLVEGSTFMVAVTLYHRAEQDDGRNMRIDIDLSLPHLNVGYKQITGEQIGDGPTIMTIWDYCRQFVAASPFAGPGDDPSYFQRDLQTNTNIIRIAVVSTASVSRFFREKWAFQVFRPMSVNGSTPFVSWIATTHHPLDLNTLWFEHTGYTEDQQIDVIRSLVMAVPWRQRLHQVPFFSSSYAILGKTAQTLESRFRTDENGTNVLRLLIGDQEQE